MSTSLTKVLKNRRKPLTALLKAIGQENADRKSESNETIAIRNLWQLLTKGYIRFADDHIIFVDAQTWTSILFKTMEITDGKPGAVEEDDDLGVDPQQVITPWQVQQDQKVVAMMTDYDEFEEPDTVYAPQNVSTDFDIDATL